MSDPALPRQLNLALGHRESFDRADFLTGRANETALALIDRWTDWPARAIALIGPEGSGKSHLAASRRRMRDRQPRYRRGVRAAGTLQRSVGDRGRRPQQVRRSGPVSSAQSRPGTVGLRPHHGEKDPGELADQAARSRLTPARIAGSNARPA